MDIVANLILALFVIVASVFLYRLIALVVSLWFAIPYVGTPRSAWPHIAHEMKLRREDRLIDLGSGFGSIDYYFASTGARVHSLELNALFIIAQRTRNILARSKIIIIHNRIEQYDLAKYNKVYMYWQPAVIEALFPSAYSKARKGTVFYSYYYPFPSRFSRQRRVKLPNKAFLYILSV